MLTKGLTLHSYWKWVDWNPIYTIWKGGVCIRRTFHKQRFVDFFFVVVHLDTPRKFKTDTKKDWCCVLILTSFFRMVFYIFGSTPPPRIPVAHEGFGWDPAHYYFFVILVVTVAGSGVDSKLIDGLVWNAWNPSMFWMGQVMLKMVEPLTSINPWKNWALCHVQPIFLYHTCAKDHDTFFFVCFHVGVYVACAQKKSPE